MRCETDIWWARDVLAGCGVHRRIARRVVPVFSAVPTAPRCERRKRKRKVCTSYKQVEKCPIGFGNRPLERALLAQRCGCYHTNLLLKLIHSFALKLLVWVALELLNLIQLIVGFGILKLWVYKVQCSPAEPD